MIAYAAHQYTLAARQPDGATLRDHLEAAARHMHGRRPEGLDGPPCPPELEYLWGMFRDLSNRRSSTSLGAAPITWLDIDAWQRTARLALTPFEQECLCALDGIFLQAAHKTPKP